MMLVFAFLYEPIISVTVYYFNYSRLGTVWGGFDTKCFVFFKGYGDHRDLPSFPTRRSSDLAADSAKKKTNKEALSKAHAQAFFFRARLPRSEEHTSELQSHDNLVFRLL